MVIKLTIAESRLGYYFYLTGFVQAMSKISNRIAIPVTGAKLS